jgi:hypothetical protein
MACDVLALIAREGYGNPADRVYPREVADA